MSTYIKQLIYVGTISPRILNFAVRSALAPPGAHSPEGQPVVIHPQIVTQRALEKNLAIFSEIWQKKFCN
jgi:hypothetical protein